jgi:hypothetical protein
MIKLRDTTITACRHALVRMQGSSLVVPTAGVLPG